MDTTSDRGRRLIAMLLFACVTYPSRACLAGENEQVELMEKAVAQFERLNNAASAYSAILERVTDAQSADSVVEQIEPAAKAFIAEMEALPPVIAAGMKEARTGAISSAENQARAQAVAQKQPALVQEWQTQAARFAKEINRVAQLEGLSAHFRDVFGTQAGRVKLSVVRLGNEMEHPTAPPRGARTAPGNPRPQVDTTPGGVPGGPSSYRPPGVPAPPDRSQIKNYDQLVAQYGKDRMVRVEVTNYGEVRANRDAIGQAIFEAAAGADRGPVLPSQPGEPVTSSYDSTKGTAFAAPVGNFNEFCKMLNFAQVVERNDAERLLRIKIDPAKIVVNSSDNNPLTAFYNDYVGRYGKDKVVRIQVVNRDESRGDFHFAEVALSSLQTEIHIVDGFSGNGIIAPVRDFDALCKSLLAFAEIIERNDAEKKLKIKVDQAKAQRIDEDRFSRNQSDLRAPAATRDELNRRDGNGGSSSRSGMERELPKPSDPDYHKKLCDLMLDEVNWTLNDEAVDALLLVKPQDIQDKNVRKQIAVNFRTLAMKGGHPEKVGKAVRGLILYGGKYSVPILVDLLKRQETKAPDALFEGLAAFPDAQGADAATGQLSNFFNREAAAAALRKMGPVAEPALIKAAPSNDADVSLAAVKLLGEVGTEKSLTLLGKATKSTNQEVADAAKESIKSIRERTRKPAK